MAQGLSFAAIGLLPAAAATFVLATYAACDRPRPDPDRGVIGDRSPMTLQELPCPRGERDERDESG